MRSAEFQDAKLYVLDRETRARTAVRGDVSPDCRSIVWKGERDAVLGTWER
jgi:hypothetical protein